MKKITFYFSVLSIFLLSGIVASSISDATVHSEKIVLGSGCFWGAEKGYEALPGVIDAVSGYADGDGVRPTYREITKLKNKFNPNNHAEVVEVTYNKNIISTEGILIHYLESHDPTQVNRQGNDIGTQYRSAIYCITENELKIAKSYINELIVEKVFTNLIVTEVNMLTRFYNAEIEHKDYFDLNTNQPYCAAVISPKIKKLMQQNKEILK